MPHARDLSSDDIRGNGCLIGAVLYVGWAISLFRSIKEPDVFGFTADPTGANLPAEFAL
jgi:hypothetical protein